MQSLITKPSRRTELLAPTLAFAGCTLALFAAIIAIRHGVAQQLFTPQGWPNPLDIGVTTYLNQYANRWPALDSLARLFESQNTLKGMPIVCLYWAAFFQKLQTRGEELARRKVIAASAALPMVAVLMARILALSLPHRQRPLHVAALHFQLPHGEQASTLAGWSSFPSDHAALFIALAVGLFLTSRVLGSIALIYSMFFVLIPRVYLGLHWTTDVLGGALLGAAIAAIALIPSYRDRMWHLICTWGERSPGTLGLAAFILSYQVADIFGGPLLIATIFVHLLHHSH